MGITLGSVNLSDRAKYRKVELRESANYRIKIEPGCSDGFPVVHEFRPVYWVRPMRTLSIGATEDLMFANQNAILAALVDAADKSKPPVYLIRTVRNQTTPHVWTVLGGVPTRDLQHWDGIYKSWLDVDLYVYPGMRIPEGL